MNATERLIFEALLRNDLASFIQRCFQTVAPGDRFLPNWHIEAIAYHLERVRRGEIRRLIITIPPRNLKSICVSMAFPAYVLGHDPTSEIVCVSYSQELAVKLARGSRLIMKSPWYRRVFPRTRIDPRKDTESEFATTAQGGRLATSVGGTLTGRGGNFILIDDPMKPAEAMSDTRRRWGNDWYDSTLSSRLNDKKEDAIVLVMQRPHVDDLVGHLLEKDSSWVHLNLPAVADVPQEIEIGDGLIYRRALGELLHPEREPIEVLEEMKTLMGSLLYSAQYQQAPVPPGGALVQREWFRTYSRRPDKELGDRVVQSWDTASKTSPTNDFSVCTTGLIRKSDCYILDVVRKRLEFPELRQQVLEQARIWKPKAILIEDAGIGGALIQDLARESGIRPIGIHPEREKVVRLEGVSAMIEAGHVLLPESAAWVGDFLAEILAFPNARHDDQVDSLSQFLGYARRPRPKVHA